LDGEDEGYPTPLVHDLPTWMGWGRKSMDHDYPSSLAGSLEEKVACLAWMGVEEEGKEENEDEEEVFS